MTDETIPSLIQETDSLTILKDPFLLQTIHTVSITYTKGFGDKFYAFGRVEFINGNTKGEQRFKGTDFDHVALQVKAFLETIQKKSNHD